MPLALMSLGENVFYTPMVGVESPGYETFNRDSVFTWVPQSRLNAPVAMQFTGPGQDIIVIEGRCFPSFFGGALTLDALRAVGAQGKPQALIRYFPTADASGNRIQGIEAQVLGDFVIMRVRTGERHINSAGAPEMIEFQLELAAYGNDTAITSQTASFTASNTTAADASQAKASQPAAQGSYGPSA